MIYNFETDDKVCATAALLVYAIYRSRDKSRFKVSLDMWGRIQRFIRASAKRAKDIPEFIDKLLPMMECSSINPKWLEIGVKGRLFNNGGTLIDIPNEQRREFFTEALATINHRSVIKVLRGKSQYIIMLVRDRLETEKPLEATFDVIDEEYNEQL